MREKGAAKAPDQPGGMRSFLVAIAVFGCTTAAFAQTPPPSPSAAPPAPAQARDPAKARIDQVLGGRTTDPAWFSSSVPAGAAVQVEAVVAQLKAALGAYLGADRRSTGVYIARFEKGTDEVNVHLDGSGKIDGIFFKPPAMTNASLDDALKTLGAQPHVSYVLLEGSTQRGAADPDKPLAIGSAFKLAVLAALHDQVVAHKRNWSDVILLDPKLESLPSGVLQSWPAGTPVTLAAAATEMISISDNTAADTLRALVLGPDLDRYAARNVPFLSTRALFVMKADTGADLLRRWQGASASERVTVLREAEARPLPSIGDYPSAPRALDAEWIYSVRELCGLMARVAELPLMSVNTGLADRAAFRRVAFKGGSEPGVLNFTTSVVTKRGTTACLSATVNDPAQAVDETAVGTAYAGVLGALAGR
ncbi:MAG: serine hydrolase [Candidatus Elarobacter sp.]